jgi:hypothetical protein
MFVSNPSNDPVLRRGERLTRYGSLIPALSLCLVNIAGAILHTIETYSITRVQYQSILLALTVVGQAIVWIGMDGLRRSQGWDSGILFYVWMGGLFTSLTVTFTGIFPPAVIPWIAPVVATVAKRRLLRRKRLFDKGSPA